MFNRISILNSFRNETRDAMGLMTHSELSMYKLSRIWLGSGPKISSGMYFETSASLTNDLRGRAMEINQNNSGITQLSALSRVSISDFDLDIEKLKADCALLSHINRIYFPLAGQLSVLATNTSTVDAFPAEHVSLLTVGTFKLWATSLWLLPKGSWIIDSDFFLNNRSVPAFVHRYYTRILIKFK